MFKYNSTTNRESILMGGIILPIYIRKGGRKKESIGGEGDFRNEVLR